MRKNAIRFMVALCAVLCLPAPLLAAERNAAPNQQQAEAIVAHFEERYEDAWNRGDADAFGRILAKNVVFHTVSGLILAGRETMIEDSRKRYASANRPPAIDDVIKKVEVVTPEIIIAQGNSLWKNGNKYFFTKVLLLEDGEWKMVAGQFAAPAQMFDRTDKDETR